MSNEPYFRSFGESSTVLSAEAAKAQAIEANETRAAASHEASERDMAYMKALGRPAITQVAVPPVKTPVLPPEFAQRVAALDEAIYKRGIALDRDKLLGLGKERFAALLAAHRKVLEDVNASAIDVTSWPSTQSILHAFESSVVPRRSMSEQHQGYGKERDQVRKIASFEDLWKDAKERQEVTSDIYAFRDLFESLVFGQSLLDRLSSDGRLHSRFFCGGHGRKLELLRDWLGVLHGPLTSVALVQPLWHLVAWLTGEKASPPSRIDLARDFFTVRAPTLAQIRMADAVLNGFLLGYNEWALWEYVGRRTRTMPDAVRLGTWRKALAARYPRVSSFHHEVRVAFFKDVGYGHESHREFDASGHRSFIARTVHTLLRQVSAVLALALETTYPGCVIARFEGLVLCKGKPKQRAEIAAHFAAAFPGSAFAVACEEVVR
jgi:hypothetical protein